MKLAVVQVATDRKRRDEFALGREKRVWGTLSRDPCEVLFNIADTLQLSSKLYKLTSLFKLIAVKLQNCCKIVKLL